MNNNQEDAPKSWLGSTYQIRYRPERVLRGASRRVFGVEIADQNELDELSAVFLEQDLERHCAAQRGPCYCEELLLHARPGNQAVTQIN